MALLEINRNSAYTLWITKDSVKHKGQSLLVTHLLCTSQPVGLTPVNPQVSMVEHYLLLQWYS